MDPQYQASDKDPIFYLAPAFSFQSDYLRLSKMRRQEEGYLHDAVKNTQLEEAFRNLQNDSQKRIEALLKGLAYTWEREARKLTLDPDIVIPAWRMRAENAPLNLGNNAKVTLLYASGFKDSQIQKALERLAKSPAPVLVITEEEDQRIDELQQKLMRNVPKMSPFTIFHNLNRQITEFVMRMGLMGQVFQEEDLRTSHFHAVIGVARDHLAKTLDDWKTRLIDAGLVLSPLFFSGKRNEDELRAFARGYAAMLSGMRYDEVRQMSSNVFANEAESDSFRKMAERHEDPGPDYEKYTKLELIQKDEYGELRPVVPQSFIALIKTCHSVSLNKSDLEHYFLFELPKDKDIKPKEIIRHLTLLLDQMAIIELSGDRISLIHQTIMERRVRAAHDWLDGEFQNSLQKLQNIHSDAAEELNRQAKEAYRKLKTSAQQIRTFSLSFVNQPIDELIREEEEEPVYVKQFQQAFKIIRDWQQTIKWVLDSSAKNAFQFSRDSLREFETQGSSAQYPLWKRLVVLEGFYAHLNKERKELVQTIEDLNKDVDIRVPELDSGEKAFPIQALTEPLRLYQQELDFPSEKPDRTIHAAGTSLGINSLGFKIASKYYLEAMDRLDFIKEELTAPGKLVLTFMDLLQSWESLKAESIEVKSKVQQLEQFFTDASEEIKRQYRIDEIHQAMDDMEDAIEREGIREGTDARDSAGVPAVQLVDELAKDLDKVKDDPRALQASIEKTEQSILPSLQEQFQSKYQDELSAFTRIQMAQDQPKPQWPERRAETYGKTLKLFEALTEQIEKEGKAFFEDSDGTRFEDFVGLCRLQNQNQWIDWSLPEFNRHVQTLMDKKLLQLKLI